MYFFLKLGHENAKWIYLRISVLKKLIFYFLPKKSPYLYGTRRMRTNLQGQLLDYILTHIKPVLQAPKGYL